MDTPPEKIAARSSKSPSKAAIMPKIDLFSSVDSIAKPVLIKTSVDSIIEEESISASITYELPPTPPSYVIERHLKTPSDKNALFKNIDYLGMSVEDLKQRSAIRVKILENGEVMADRTWSEVKFKLMNAEHDEAEEHEPEESKSKRLAEFYSEKKPGIASQELILRRSDRLAKMKASSVVKRKLSSEKKGLKRVKVTPKRL